jgi:hypothetical protein
MNVFPAAPTIIEDNTASQLCKRPRRERDVFTAYPGRVEVSDHEYQEGHYLTIHSADGKSALVFDTDGTTIRSFRIGRLPEALHVEGCS